MALECRGVRTALLLLCLWMNTALAAPFAVQVGDVRMALDAPPGFSDSQFTGSPRLTDIAESLTTASNRILLFALEDEDLKRFMVGDPITLRRSVLAVTSRAMQEESLSLGGFRAYAAASLPQGATVPSADLIKYLDSKPHGLANPIGALRSDPEVVSVLVGTRLPPEHADSPPRYMVSSRTLLLLRGKALDLSVLARYQSPADLDWVRSATSLWVAELRKLNSR